VTVNDLLRVRSEGGGGRSSVRRHRRAPLQQPKEGSANETPRRAHVADDRDPDSPL